MSKVRILLISVRIGFTFLAKVFQSEFNQCLPRFLWRLLFCLSALLSGSFKEEPAGVCLDWVRGWVTWFLTGKTSRSFWCLLPSVSRQSYPQGLRSFCYSVSLFYLSLFSVSDEVGVHSSSVSVGCQLDVFSVSFNILFQNLSDLLLIFPHTKFISRLYKCRHLQVQILIGLG